MSESFAVSSRTSAHRSSSVILAGSSIVVGLGRRDHRATVARAPLGRFGFLLLRLRGRARGLGPPLARDLLRDALARDFLRGLLRVLAHAGLLRGALADG